MSPPPGRLPVAGATLNQSPLQTFINNSLSLWRALAVTNGLRRSRSLNSLTSVASTSRRKIQRKPKIPRAKVRRASSVTSLTASLIDEPQSPQDQADSWTSLDYDAGYDADDEADNSPSDAAAMHSWFSDSDTEVLQDDDSGYDADDEAGDSPSDTAAKHPWFSGADTKVPTRRKSLGCLDSGGKGFSRPANGQRNFSSER